MQGAAAALALAAAGLLGCGCDVGASRPRAQRPVESVAPDESVAPSGESSAKSSAEAPQQHPAPVPPADFTPPGADHFGSAAGLRYLERCLACPDPDAPVPMLVMIHGLGDVPSYDWFRGAEAIDTPLRFVMPQAPIPYHSGFAWFPYRVRDGDREALARGISKATERLARFLGVMRQARPTRGLPIVAGFSQGGMLSFALAVMHPEAVALSHPMSGLLPEPLWPKEQKDGVRYPRIVALHGDADDVVPIAEARSLVAHLKSLGFEVELREHPGIRHFVSDAMNAQTVALLNATARSLAKP